MHVELIKDTHQYLIDGEPCKSSVTNELEKAELSKYWNKDPWYLERGMAVHTATHLIDLKTLDWGTVDPCIIGFLEGYLKFKDESGINFEHREMSLYDPTYRFCGTPDAFYPLTDIKTGQENEVQLGGYWRLLQVNGLKTGKEAFTLLLNENGTYNFNPVANVKLLSQVFLSCLTVNRYKENQK